MARVSIIWPPTHFRLFNLGLIRAEKYMRRMKTVIYKVKRSGVYYLMTAIAPVNETKNARVDVWGAVAVVILLLGVVILMRLALTV